MVFSKFLTYIKEAVVTVNICMQCFVEQYSVLNLRAIGHPVNLKRIKHFYVNNFYYILISWLIEENAYHFIS